MNKYLLVTKNTWDEIFTYRLNFAMWRFRTVLQFLTIYILWSSLVANQTSIFGYSKSLLLTYILGTSFLSAVILSTRTQEIGDNINSGDLSIFLIKPFNYFKYWFFRDIGDKAMNIFFSFFELTLFFILLKPPFFIQTNPEFLIFAIVAILISVMLYFFFSSILGMIGFWSNEIWAPRFLSYIAVYNLSGGLYPLDIFPKGILNLLQLLPFPYLLYFPLKVYLGQLSLIEIFKGLLISLFWVFVMYALLQIIWKIGLKRYEAAGR